MILRSAKIRKFWKRKKLPATWPNEHLLSWFLVQWIQNFEEKQNLSLDFRQIGKDSALRKFENLEILAEKKIAGYVAKWAPIELIFGAMGTEWRGEAESGIISLPYAIREDCLEHAYFLKSFGVGYVTK